MHVLCRKAARRSWDICYLDPRHANFGVADVESALAGRLVRKEKSAAVQYEHLESLSPDKCCAAEKADTSGFPAENPQKAKKDSIVGFFNDTESVARQGLLLTEPLTTPGHKIIGEKALGRRPTVSASPANRRHTTEYLRDIVYPRKGFNCSNILESGCQFWPGLVYPFLATVRSITSEFE